MIKFAMLLLTLFTVLGGMILGWLARRYWLGGEWCGSLETHPMPKDASNNGGLATGAIGTLAAGTAAMRYANSEGDAEGKQDAGRSYLLDSQNTLDGTVDSGQSADQVASTGAAAAVSVSSSAGATDDMESGGAVSKDSQINLPAQSRGDSGDGEASPSAAPSKSDTTDTKSDGTDTGSGAAADVTSGNTGERSDTSSATSVQGKAGASTVASLATDDPDVISGSLGDRVTSQNGDVSGAAGFMSGDQSAARSGIGGTEAQSSSNNLESHSGGMSDSAGVRESPQESRSVQSPDSSADTGATGSENGGSASRAAVTDKHSIGSNDGGNSKGATTDAASSGETVEATSSDGASGSPAAGASSGISSAASAGVGGAAIAGAAAASTAEISAEATNAELQASRAEVRALRKRLGLSDDVSSDESGMTADQKLAASREEARKLRQDLWSKEQNAENTGGQKDADTSENAVSVNFGALSNEEAEAERLLVSGNIPKGPSNGLDAPTPGYGVDDLTKIKGIGKPTQARLNRQGIYYYDQIGGFTGPDIAWADRTLNLEGRVVSDRWIPQAKLLSGDVRESDPADEGEGDESVLLVDVPSELSAEEVEAERLLASGEEIAAPASRLEAPRAEKSPDDLTKIKGIGPKINGKLNDQGIYYYEQIAGFSGSDLAWADRELDFKGRAVRDRWVPQAQGLMDAPAASAASGSEPTVAAPAGLLSKPVEGRDPDDLTAIKGVGLVLQKQLNDKGIYYYSQIADFTDSDQEWANQTLGFPGRVERDNWIPQAKDLMKSPSAGGRAARVGALENAGRELDTMSAGTETGAISAGEAEAMRLIESGEFVADNSNRPAGLLSSASEGAKDDLQRIKGVGPKLEDLLNSLGIYYFRQISNFSASDIAWVDSKLRFKGRIIRDRWVDQAKRLS